MLGILVFEELFNPSSNITEELNKSHWLRNWNIYSVRPAIRDRLFVNLPKIFWIPQF